MNLSIENARRVSSIINEGQSIMKFHSTRVKRRFENFEREGKKITKDWESECHYITWYQHWMLEDSGKGFQNSEGK